MESVPLRPAAGVQLPDPLLGNGRLSGCVTSHVSTLFVGRIHQPILRALHPPFSAQARALAEQYFNLSLSISIAVDFAPL